MDNDYPSPRSKLLMSEQTSLTLSTAISNDANPAAGMLQDMIRERRATSQRSKKAFDPITRVTSDAKSELKETQSSPITSLSSRSRPSMTTRRASGANVKPMVQKEMGLREMSEHISKVDKQNFDLKLEVFHRRQRNDILEAKLQKLEEDETDYEDLQAKYAALILESDRQRLVLEDAVAQICELQAENEEIQAENEELQATLGGHFAGIDGQEFGNRAKVSSMNGIPAVPATPPHAVRKASRSSTDDRQKSVMSSKSSASRRDQLVLPATGRGGKRETSSHSLDSSGDSHDHANPSLLSVNGAGSVFSGDDEEIQADRQMLHSPRLSILSESGFLSIYGSPHDNSHLPARDDEGSSSPASSELDSSYSRHSAQRDAEIDLWIEDRPTARKSPRSPKSGGGSPKTKTNQQYTSIEEVLSKRLVRPGDEVQVPHVQIPPRQSSSVERKHNGRHRFEKKSPPKSPSQKPRSYSSSNGSMVFGGRMPPTPDTMSTATIGGASSSTQSIVAEKSLLDHGGPPCKGYTNLVNYGRPHTSDSDSHHPIHHPSSDPSNLTFDEQLSLSRSYANADVQQVATEKYEDDRNVASPVVPEHASNSKPVAANSSSRPALTSYQTDMMFNGDGFALVQPSRTLSYPSPRRRPGASSSQSYSNSPTKDGSQNGYGTTEIGTHAISTDGTGDLKEVPIDRMKDNLRKENLSPIKSQHYGEENPIPAYGNQQRGEASRSRFGRFQFFKRTNSQHTGNQSNPQATSPRRPRNVRSQSSTRAQIPPLRSQISNGKRYLHRANSRTPIN